MTNVATASRNRSASKFFYASAVLVLAICWIIIASPAGRREPDLLAFGVTFDLCLTIPLLYWLIVVRRSGRAFALIPLFIICLAVARFLVPQPDAPFLRALSLLEVPLELTAIGWMTVRLRRARRASMATGDTLERFRGIAREMFGDNKLAEAIVLEMAALYYGLAAWRVNEDEDARVITFHRQSGWGSIVVCIIVLIVAESIGVHLFLSQWSSTAAWIFTALDVYSIIWLIGDYHAFRLRPFRIGSETIELRFGMRWSGSVPRTAIVSIEPFDAARGEELKMSKDYLRLAILDDPTFLVTFAEPVEITGLIGMRRQVRCLGVRPDDSERFLALLS